MKSSVICYGTWEKLMHCIQTLILTMDTAVALNQLENTVSDSQPWTREPLWKSTEVSSKEVPAHCLGWGGGSGVQVVCTGEGKRNNLILLISSLPQSDTTQGQERPSWLRISPTGQRFGDRVSMWLRTLLPQLWMMLSKRIISLLPHPEYAVVSCLTEGWEKAGRKADSSLAGLQRDMDPTNQTMDSIKKPSGDTLPLGPCSWPTGTLMTPHALLINSPTHLWRFSWCAPNGSKNEHSRWLLSICRKPAHICRTRRSHKLQL